MVCDEVGRYIIASIETDKECYALVNIYAPNDPNLRNSFFKHINEKLSECSTGSIIVGGYLNEVLNPAIDRRSRCRNIPKKKKASSCIGKMNKNHDLVDIWRVKNKNKSQFTWKRSGLYEASRIDYFLINTILSAQIHSCDIRPAQIGKTTHLAVSLKLKFDESNRDRGVWKVNNSILQEAEYRLLINETIERCAAEANRESLNHQNVWENIKSSIREAFQNYTKRRALRVKNNCSILENELSQLYKYRDQNLVISKTTSNKIQNIENELERIYDYRAKAAQVRARAEWTEYGEKNTKFFLGLEKSNQTKKNIQKLTTNDGRTLTDSRVILQEEVSYYRSLYTSKNISKEDITTYLNSTNLTITLSQTDSETCENEISLDDCKNALFSMKLNKSPGSDGLSVEFYQAFWDNLKVYFYNSLKEIYQNGYMSETQRKGILSLIFKKADPTKPKQLATHYIT